MHTCIIYLSITKCCSSNEQIFNEEIDMKQCSAYGMVVSTQTETGQHNSNVYELVA